MASYKRAADAASQGLFRQEGLISIATDPGETGGQTDTTGRKSEEVAPLLLTLALEQQVQTARMWQKAQGMQ